MTIVVTGADGFLGWHLRVRALAEGMHELRPISRANWSELDHLVSTADAVIHLAGVNRGEDLDVEGGNVALARDVARAVEHAERPSRIVFANSIQSGNGTPYGSGKEGAAARLREAAAKTGGHFTDVRLPNLFGEHGRPHYNSFVATFVEFAASGGTPDIVDRPVPLLHAQDAAATLLGVLEDERDVISPAAVELTVAEVWDRLSTFASVYATGDIPRLDTPTDVALFNTLRARLFPKAYPLGLQPRNDQRGSLVETVRSHGGEGQTFVSTTRPQVTRGEHFHLRKIERFVVLSGHARIALRRVLTDDAVSFDVSGEAPALIDMPTMWSHNITNVGDEELVTLFWTNELFNPEDTDTYPDRVDVTAALAC